MLVAAQSRRCSVRKGRPVEALHPLRSSHAPSLCGLPPPPTLSSLWVFWQAPAILPPPTPGATDAAQRFPPPNTNPLQNPRLLFSSFIPLFLVLFPFYIFRSSLHLAFPQRPWNGKGIFFILGSASFIPSFIPSDSDFFLFISFTSPHLPFTLPSSRDIHFLVLFSSPIPFFPASASRRMPSVL